MVRVGVSTRLAGALACCLCLSCGSAFLSEDNARFIVQSELGSTDGFVTAEVAELQPGWGQASVAARFCFRLEGLPDEWVPADLELARIDGQWRVLEVGSRGESYSSLAELGAQTMDDLHARRRAAIANEVNRRAQEMSEEAIKGARELGGAVKRGLGDWLN